MKMLKCATAACLAASLMSGPVSAAVLSANGTEAEATAARTLWETAVGGTFLEDNLDGLNGVDALTSSAGNSFVANNGTILSRIDNRGLMDGTILRSRVTHGPISFTWNTPLAVNAFGFDGFDPDLGTVSVMFNDGTSQRFDTQTSGNNTSFFWGITDLSAAVASITIRTTDRGGTMLFDRFVYANTSASQSSVIATPLPGSVFLLAGALAMFGFWVRKGRTETA